MPDYILAVDDDMDDLFMLRQALNEVRPSIEMKEAIDGIDALEKLEEAKEKDSLPCLIVLDLNMPRLDGKQALKRIKADEKLQQVPVIVFTTSSSLLDTAFSESYKVEHIVKPTVYSELVSTVKKMVNACT
jgi:CheY-like chemotaxis protein